MVAAAAGTTPALKARFLDFLFLFAAATAHELVHLFVHLLSGGSDEDVSYTPPGTSHLNYGSVRQGVTYGESGRFFENLLFGGSLEFYYNPRDDNGQVSFAFFSKPEKQSPSQQL